MPNFLARFLFSIIARPSGFEFTGCPLTSSPIFLRFVKQLSEDEMFLKTAFTRSLFLRNCIYKLKWEFVDYLSEKCSRASNSPIFFEKMPARPRPDRASGGPKVRVARSPLLHTSKITATDVFP